MKLITIYIAGNSMQAVAEVEFHPGWRGKGNEEPSLVMTLTTLDKEAFGVSQHQRLSTMLDKGDARVIAAYLKSFADEV